MIKSKNIIVAETVIRDIATQQVSAINLIRRIKAKPFPFNFPKLSIVHTLEREESDVTTVEVNLQVNNNEKEIFFVTQKVVFNTNSPFIADTVSNFGNLPIAEEGYLSFVFTSDSFEKTEYKIVLTK